MEQFKILMYMMKMIFVFFLWLICTCSNAQIVKADRDANWLYGFKDEKGRWVVKPQYYSARWDISSKTGTYRMESGGSEGLLDESGKVIIPHGQYKDCYVYKKDGYIKVTDMQGRTGATDLSGKIVFPVKYKDINMYYYTKGFVKITDESNRRGLVTLDDKIVLQPDANYAHIYISDNGITISTVDDSEGFADLSGNILVPTKYKNVVGYPNFIRVEDKAGKMGVFSYDGKLLVPFEYTYISEADDEIFIVSKDAVYKDYKCEGGKYGYYANGKEIIPCIYDDASGFKNGVATVKKDGEVKLIRNPLRDGAQIDVADGATPSKKKKTGPAVSRYPAPDSDVDKDIPVAKKAADNVFAFIIANENYADAPVPYSLNDGRMFKEYCQKTLGLPEKNTSLYEDATFGGIITAVEKMKQIADAYDGEASIIFYYAGHGFPDDKQSTAYLLPIDGDAASITTTGYSLAKLYGELSQMKLKSAVVFLDACFSGAKREDQMLTSARGVAIKVKNETPQGKLLVFSAAQGDETAHQMEDNHHGLFTYFLLKSLQQTQGNVTLGELTDYVTKQVKRQSVVINNKKQTPTVVPSDALQNYWQTMKLK